MLSPQDSLKFLIRLKRTWLRFREENPYIAKASSLAFKDSPNKCRLSLITSITCFSLLAQASVDKDKSASTKQDKSRCCMSRCLHTGATLLAWPCICCTWCSIQAPISKLCPCIWRRRTSGEVLKLENMRRSWLALAFNELGMGAGSEFLGSMGIRRQWSFNRTCLR